jgi:hypothetical protein
MIFDTDVTLLDTFSLQHESPDATVIKHMSVSFYMGFINFDVSYRDFYEQRIQRTIWLGKHFHRFIPFRFWKRIIDADVSPSFLDTLLPSDYTPSTDELTLPQLAAFLKRFIYWECGNISDIETYFKKRKNLQTHQK